MAKQIMVICTRIKRLYADKKWASRSIVYMYRNCSICYYLYIKEKKKCIHLSDHICINSLWKHKQKIGRIGASVGTCRVGESIPFCFLCTSWFGNVWIFNLFETINLYTARHKFVLGILNLYIQQYVMYHQTVINNDGYRLSPCARWSVQVIELSPHQ